jgi:hypothetical protein
MVLAESMKASAGYINIIMRHSNNVIISDNVNCD